MTLAQLEALEERRTIRVRHERFNAALITSAIVNANRGRDTEAVSPFDFLAGFETDPEEVEKQKLRDSTRHAIAVAFAEMRGATKEQLTAEKNAMVKRMAASGIDDPEGLIREVYPDL